MLFSITSLYFSCDFIHNIFSCVVEGSSLVSSSGVCGVIVYSSDAYGISV
jgi:hypothetical protein